MLSQTSDIYITPHTQVSGIITDNGIESFRELSFQRTEGKHSICTCQNCRPCELIPDEAVCTRHEEEKSGEYPSIERERAHQFSLLMESYG